MWDRELLKEFKRWKNGRENEGAPLGQGESSPFMNSKLYRDERHDRKSLKCLD